ncbi:PfkB family carbohydrate kinase [Streptomyces sp. NBC_01304]|uniref:PfkB family carbohydrate kinase n=1 Tax=Streptomyces sp. NBC_01304 TaxID=2903818 RepID=UPI002E0E6546|nr:PfkB family carbohydrate kinase [Streptomyces sp. NBC_01304]
MPLTATPPKGLFVGLCTLDVIQLVDHIPASNEKIVATRQTVAAGGPAANAAATFSHLGGEATLLTGLGQHALTAGITGDLDSLGVRIVDLSPHRAEPPTVSSILVTAATGDRAVSSVNAIGAKLEAPSVLSALLDGIEVVEFDGHHMDLAVRVAKEARSADILTVFDGGSWKPGTEQLLPFIDVALCSANFHPPGTMSPQDVLEYLQAAGVQWAAISHGPDPIEWTGTGGSGSTDVPKAEVMDTLGAGDILHGALAYHLRGTRHPSATCLQAALQEAGAVASRACAAFGTRTWMEDSAPLPSTGRI